MIKLANGTFQESLSNQLRSQNEEFKYQLKVEKSGKLGKGSSILS